MKNIEKLQRYAKISCEIEPDGEHPTRCEAGIELVGTTNGLLNAWEALSTEIFKKVIAVEGKRTGTALYAMVQMQVLENLCIDPAEEMKKAEARKNTLLNRIFGKREGGVEQ